MSLDTTGIVPTDSTGSPSNGTVFNAAFFSAIYAAINALIGNRVDVTFAAGNFTGNGAMTWALASGDQAAFWYQIHNKLMTVGFRLDTTSVGGTPSTELRITIPGGKVAAVVTNDKVALASDNGTTREAWMQVSGSTIAILRQDQVAWTASANNTSVYGTVTFPIS